MPFESEAQRRWMYANDPEMAKRWQAHTPKGAKLPARKKKMKSAVKALPANLQDVSVEKAAEMLAMQKQANILQSLKDPSALLNAAKSTMSHYSDPANWSTGQAAMGGAALGALGGAGSSLLDQKKRKHLLHNTLAGALAGGAVGGGAKMVMNSDWLSKALSSLKEKPMGGVTDPKADPTQQTAAAQPAATQKLTPEMAAQKLTPEMAEQLRQNVDAATSNAPELARGVATAGGVAATGLGAKYIGKPMFNMWNKAHPDFQEIAARSLPAPTVLQQVGTGGALHPDVSRKAESLAAAYKQNPGAAIGTMKNTIKGELPTITRMQRLSRWMPRKAKYTGGAAGLLALLLGGKYVQEAVSNRIGQMYKDRSDAAARLAELTANAMSQNK